MGITSITMGIDSHQQPPLSAQQCAETVNTDNTFLAPNFCGRDGSDFSAAVC